MLSANCLLADDSRQWGLEPILFVRQFCGLAISAKNS
jgi:hypothetical protein